MSSAVFATICACARARSRAVSLVALACAGAGIAAFGIDALVARDALVALVSTGAGVGVAALAGMFLPVEILFSLT